jgi:hypothetical protein
MEDGHVHHSLVPAVQPFQLLAMCKYPSNASGATLNKLLSVSPCVHTPAPIPLVPAHDTNLSSTLQHPSLVHKSAYAHALLATH